MKKLSVLIVTMALVIGLATQSQAFNVVGTGAGALNTAGVDLTDPENDGNEGAYAPPNLAGFDAEFFSSNEPGFGGGEFAFNVFDNVLSGGNGKWCCGGAAPQIVGADFSNTLATGDQGIQLTGFTVSSANDVPARDPHVWRIEGSNNTTTGLDGDWTTIYDHPQSVSDWGNTRFQVNFYSPVAGDVFETSDPFKAFRMVTESTGLTGGAFFQIGEIEFFGEVQRIGGVPEPTTAILLGLGGLAIVRRRRTA